MLDTVYVERVDSTDISLNFSIQVDKYEAILPDRPDVKHHGSGLKKKIHHVKRFSVYS